VGKRQSDGLFSVLAACFITKTHRRNAAQRLIGDRARSDDRHLVLGLAPGASRSAAGRG